MCRCGVDLKSTKNVQGRPDLELLLTDLIYVTLTHDLYQWL